MASAVLGRPEGTMDDILRSHTWEDRPGIRPAVRAAVEITGDCPGQITRCRNPCWVLDYEFGHYGRIRVGSERHGVWRERLPCTAHLYPPRTLYIEDTRRQREKRHSAWLDFVGGKEAGLSRFVLKKYGYARFLDETGRLGAAFQEAALAAHEEDESGFWTAQRALSSAIGLLTSARHLEAETYVIRPEPEAPEKLTLAEAVHAHLRKRLTDKVTLSGIAQALSLSVSTLCHRYRQETGRSPMQSLLRLRIEQAQPLLQKGYPLKQIADQLGFSDAFHLSKTFKRFVGQSPRDFLNRRSATRA
jgi:AraC-like DNA-binding protein